nr:hypothetical protein CFP56_02687 [Quercus suber]
MRWPGLRLALAALAANSTPSRTRDSLAPLSAHLSSAFPQGSEKGTLAPVPPVSRHAQRWTRPTGRFATGSGNRRRSEFGQPGFPCERESRAHGAPSDTHHHTVRSAVDCSTYGTSHRHRLDRDHQRVSGQFCTDGGLISTRTVSPSADVKRCHLAMRPAAVCRTRGGEAPLDEYRDAFSYPLCATVYCTDPGCSDLAIYRPPRVRTRLCVTATVWRTSTAPTHRGTVAASFPPTSFFSPPLPPGASGAGRGVNRNPNLQFMSILNSCPPQSVCTANNKAYPHSSPELCLVRLTANRRQ